MKKDYVFGEKQFFSEEDFDGQNQPFFEKNVKSEPHEDRFCNKGQTFYEKDQKKLKN